MLKATLKVFSNVYIDHIGPIICIGLLL